MKRLHKTPIIVAVLLFAASAISTSAFAVDYDTETRITYFENGETVGGQLSSSCLGWNYTWGQQGGDFKMERAIRCDDRTEVYCSLYRWTGSDWEYVSDCDPDGNRERPDRPLP